MRERIEEEKEEGAEGAMTEDELWNQKLVGGELRRLREAMGLTPMDVASRMGPSYTGKFVSQFEDGDIPMEIGPFFSMVRVLQPNLNELLPKRLMARRVTESLMKMDEESQNALGVIVERVLATRRGAD